MNWDAGQRSVRPGIGRLTRRAQRLLATDVTGHGANQTSITGTTVTLNAAPIGWAPLVSVTATRTTTWNVAAGPRTFSDNFNRADGGLGSNWAAVSGVPDLPPISGNHVIVSGLGVNNAAVPVGTFGANQWARVACSLGPDYSEAGVILHTSDGNNVMSFIYTINGMPYGPGVFGSIVGPAIQMYFIEAGTPRFLAEASTSGTGTHVVYGVNVGRVFQLWFDGVRVPGFSVDDSAHTTLPLTASPGFTIHQATAGTPTICDDFSGGDFVATTPTLSSLSPSSAAAGATITLTGTNFVTDATMVTISGTGYPVTVVSPTSGTFVVPALAPATVSVTCTTPGGTSGSQNLTITGGGSTGTDDFNRADGMVGNGWSTGTEYWPDPLVIVSNAVQIGAGLTAGALKRTTATNNTWIELVVSGVNNTDTGLDMMLCTDASGNGYAAWFDYSGAWWGNIGYNSGGVYTGLGGSDASATTAYPMTLRFEIVGGSSGTLNLKVNGTTVMSVSASRGYALSQKVLFDSYAYNANTGRTIIDAASWDGDAAGTTSVSTSRTTKWNVEPLFWKGVGLVSEGHVTADNALLKVSWFYDWASYTVPGHEDDTSGNVQYVPMMWGDWINDPRWGTATGDGTLGGNPASSIGNSKILLGFNEPDDNNQAAMSVSRALALWPQLEATGARLGSPAPSAGGGGLPWLASFMSGNGGGYIPRVDFICCHWYPDYNVQSLASLLDGLWATYGKPIWLTEVSQLGGSTSDNATLIDQVLPLLISRPWVERVAWFTVRDNTGFSGTQLVENTGALSTAGAVYDNYPAYTVRAATSPVSASRTTTWAVRTPVTATRASIWAVLTPVAAATRSTTWKVAASVTATRATTWQTLVPVSAAATRTTTWVTKANITAARATLWSTLAPVGAVSRVTTWATRVSVTASRATTWAAVQGVIASRATTWNVAGSAVNVTSNT